MGTQQILLIVLSVIIVGAAVAVGIDMFNRQDFTSNRSSAASDVQIFLTQVLQYYKMPTSLGGLSGDLDNVDGNNNAGKADTIAKYIGWGDNHPMKNDNAHYLIEIPEGIENVIYIKAIGRSSLAGKRPVVHGRIRFPDGEIRSRVGEIELTTDVTETDFNFDLWETE